MSCVICCESYNNRDRRSIECVSCSKSVCMSCVGRNLEDGSGVGSLGLNCMLCNTEWSDEFVKDNFTRIFIKTEIKNHRENYLLEKQLALLPETQKYAEREKSISFLEKDIKRKKEILKKKEKELKDKKEGNLEKEEIMLKIVKCPMLECTGYLNKDNKCGMCEKVICKSCMENKEEGHECDEDKKATIALIKHDSKGCPKCGELINKIDGCDQMYCIMCHTAFSWITNKIDHGTVHNPEYFRWMRENNKTIERNPGDDGEYDVCGDGLIHATDFIHLIRHYYTRKNNLDATEVIVLTNIYRLIRHIDAVNHWYNRFIEGEIVEKLKGLRIEYLLKQISKDNFKCKIQQIDKKREKNKKLLDVWNLLRIVLKEYIGRIVELCTTGENKKKVQKEIENILKEAEGIRVYVNEGFKKVGVMYEMVYPGITYNWMNTANWKSYLNSVKANGTPNRVYN